MCGNSRWVSTKWSYYYKKGKKGNHYKNIYIQVRNSHTNVTREKIHGPNSFHMIAFKWSWSWSWPRIGCWVFVVCFQVPPTANSSKSSTTLRLSPTTTTTTTSPYQPSHPTPLSPDPPSLKFCFGFRPSPPFPTLPLPPSFPAGHPKTGHLSKLFLSFSVYSPGFSPPEPWNPSERIHTGISLCTHVQLLSASAT